MMTETTETMNMNPESLTMNHLPQIMRMHATLPDRDLNDLLENHPDPVVRESCQRLLNHREAEFWNQQRPQGTWHGPLEGRREFIED